VTPRVWSSEVKALQIFTTGALWANNSSIFLTNNTFTDGTDKYITTAAATRYYQSSGSHIWNTAASGTAGNAVTFTQTMTLDPSGQLVLNSNPSTLWLGDSSTGSFVKGTNTGGYLIFGTGGSERARIDSSGNLLVGGTTAYGQITAYTSQGGSTISATHGTGGTYPKAAGISFGATSTSYAVSNNGGTVTFTGGCGIYSVNTAASGNPTSMAFWVNAGGSPAEAARIDSSGNLLVGTTSGNAKFQVSNSGAAGLEFSPTSGYLGGPYIQAFNRSTSAFIPVELIASTVGFIIGSTEAARITAGGDVGIGNSAPPMRLGLSTAGAVISGTATIGTNMRGIQVYNTTTATSNNAVGIWFPSGPHQAGIASFRSDAATTWNTVLAFYTHGAVTSALNDCYERMRITGEGNVSIGTSGEKARLFVAGDSAAIALGSFRPNDGFARSIEVCYGQSGTFNTLTIEANLNGPGGYCYELNSGGTSGGFTSIGGGYINGAVNFSHSAHTSGGSGSLVVSCPSGNIVRFVLTGGSGVHPVCTFKITGSLSQDFNASNITVVYS
jgi:hypothetical protein